MAAMLMQLGYHMAQDLKQTIVYISDTFRHPSIFVS